MSDTSNEPRNWLVAILTVLGCGLVCAIVFFARSGNTAARDEVQSQFSELKLQLDDQQHRFVVLEEEIQRLHNAAFPTDAQANAPAGNSVHEVEADLARWIAGSTRTQSNTAVLLARLVAQFPAASEPVLTTQQKWAAYTALEASTEQELQRLEVLKGSAAELLFELNVPDEVATMDASTGLDMASLSAYWPYFEAKKERDVLQRMVDVVQMRLVQSRIQLGLDEAKVQNQ